jgi:hypothetical protein
VTAAEVRLAVHKQRVTTPTRSRFQGSRRETIMKWASKTIKLIGAIAVVSAVAGVYLSGSYQKSGLDLPTQLLAPRQPEADALAAARRFTDPIPKLSPSPPIQASEHGQPQLEPFFPWPPPQPYARDVISRDVFVRKGINTIGQVSGHIVSELGSSGRKAIRE